MSMLLCCLHVSADRASSGSRQTLRHQGAASEHADLCYIMASHTADKAVYVLDAWKASGSGGWSACIDDTFDLVRFSYEMHAAYHTALVDKVDI